MSASTSALPSPPDGSRQRAKTVTLRITSENARFLCGIEVNSEGEALAPASADERQHIIDQQAILKRTPLRMNLHYAQLEEVPGL